MSLRNRSWTRWLVGGLLAFVVLWVVFFDSHSVLKRLRFRREYAQLVEENRALHRKIDTLKKKLETPPSDALIEEIAREQYGMRRPGETVYRVETRETEQK